MEHELFYVYILVNLRGKFYVGSTSDLARRIDEHNSDQKIASK